MPHVERSPQAQVPRPMTGIVTSQPGMGITEVGAVSGFPGRYRADVVHLPQLDAVVAQDRVRHRRMEEEVRDRDVDEVVVALEPAPTEPRRRDLAVLGAGEVLRRYALQEREALLDPLPQLGVRLLR